MASAHISLAELQSAIARVSPVVHRTPVLTCAALDAMATAAAGGIEKRLYFKCENLQKTGSFKARGAVNSVLAAVERATAGTSARPVGFVTHSSGNHGQALSWASSMVGLPCSVVVPRGTPAAKTTAIVGYGAELVVCDPTPQARKEKGYTVVPPFDFGDVIAGQSTLAFELHEQVPDLDAVLAPISGGGLTSGIALATSHVRPACKVIPVEPVGKELGASLKARSRLWSGPPRFLDTIADGIRLQQPGHLTFPILCDLAAGDVVTVDDDQIRTAARVLAERMKLVVEPAGAAAVAAAVVAAAQLDSKFPGLSRIGIVISGGNVDLDKLPWQQ